jgi:hypothetical protein
MTSMARRVNRRTQQAINYNRLLANNEADEVVAQAISEHEEKTEDVHGIPEGETFLHTGDVGTNPEQISVNEDLNSRDWDFDTMPKVDGNPLLEVVVPGSYFYKIDIPTIPGGGSRIVRVSRSGTDNTTLLLASFSGWNSFIGRASGTRIVAKYIGTSNGANGTTPQVWTSPALIEVNGMGPGLTASAVADSTGDFDIKIENPSGSVTLNLGLLFSLISNAPLQIVSVT